MALIMEVAKKLHIFHGKVELTDKTIKLPMVS